MNIMSAQMECNLSRNGDLFISKMFFKDSSYKWIKTFLLNITTTANKNYVKHESMQKPVDFVIIKINLKFLKWNLLFALKL